jgi:branched-chain amino acid aminotransferase
MLSQQAIHNLNGNYVLDDKLFLSFEDMGISRGYAVFDFLRTYNAKPFLLELYLRRFINSANLIGMNLEWEQDELNDIVIKTLEKNDFEGEKTIKMIATGGVSDAMVPAAKPNLAIIMRPRHDFPPEYFLSGISIITANHERYLPEAKTTCYIEATKLRLSYEAKKYNAIEPVYFNEQQVFEGSNSNIFIVKDGKYITPRSNILLGITRHVIINHLNINDLVEVMDFDLKELMGADEVFMTSSSRGITPVTMIDGIWVGNGRVGAMTSKLMNIFKDFTYSNQWEN